MASRFDAVASAGSREGIRQDAIRRESIADEFGSQVFHRGIMEKMLVRPVFKNVIDAMEGRAKLAPEHADAIAAAMKEWAVSHGATHYTHWFQPLTGATAEKHDSFIDWSDERGVIETFSGEQLIQGEPDASSFPSGGLRSTWEARGYTGWDPTSPVFLWRSGDGITLCIPSVFFSWTGDVLDFKIPLQRSERLLNDAVLRLLCLSGTSAGRVYATMGWEQEYFVIDRALRNMRPDLILTGCTVQGADPAKGQELQDHYFGAVKDRVLAYMKDFEREAIRLGIPVKTRHNEVAPAQHEVAAVFEKASVSVDHNILLMELMRQVAVRHNLSCLLHEKPFAGVNGSGKHNNWSIATDTGLNLLQPPTDPDKSLEFLILISAILEAVHDYSELLLASVGSAGNDKRLGGHEAPPAIISVFLGSSLEKILDDIEESGHVGASTGKDWFDLNLEQLPQLARHETDRNRTSPFAFTGNKFEFRAVGSTANCSFPVTVLNVTVGRCLNRLLDELDSALGNPSSAPSPENLAQAALPIIQESLRRSRPIRFTGDNYSEAWELEARKRGLPTGLGATKSYEALLHPSVVQAFSGILTREELAGRYEILMENYSLSTNIEAKVFVDMFRTQIYPAAMRYQHQLADALRSTREAVAKPPASLGTQEQKLLQFVNAVESTTRLVDTLEQVRSDHEALAEPERAQAFADKVVPAMRQARQLVDELELMVDDGQWPLPKYRELLFLV